jgi:murein DD-endopeptidase MepM/ murein hydrolase activator NlpD
MNKPLDIFELPENPQGLFGAERKYDIHTGIDFYCNEGDPVYSIEDGVVSKITQFTGEKVGSPWWNDTYAIMIKGSYLFLYGEVKPIVSVGDYVNSGQVIGNVIPVLKKDKGLPINMLHLELYELDYNGDGVIWNFNSDKPKKLLDPTNIVKELKKMFAH